MLESQMKVVCHTFDCDMFLVDWAETMADKLIARKGEAQSLEILDRTLKRLSDRQRWDSYDKVALIKFVLKQSYFP